MRSRKLPRAVKLAWPSNNVTIPDHGLQDGARRGHPSKGKEDRAAGCAHAVIDGERLARDQAALLPLPAAPYQACDIRSARVGIVTLYGDQARLNA